MNILLCVLTVLSGVLFYLGNSSAAQSSDKPWQVSVSAGFGVNDNVAIVDSTLLLSAALVGVTDRKATVGRFTVDGQYDLIRSNEHILTVGYNFFTDKYIGSSGLSTFDFLEHTVLLPLTP